jgi:hypothetical protein
MMMIIALFELEIGRFADGFHNDLKKCFTDALCE